MADRVDRKTRGLLAIAIADGIDAAGLRPISPLVANLRRVFRLELPSSATDLARQAVFARRSTAMTIGCVGLFAILILPILIPIELVRGWRVRRHNAALRQELGSSTRAHVPGYRDDASGADALQAAVQQADSVLAVDWAIWRDGVLCFAGSALGIVRGEERTAHFISVHRGPPPSDAIDGAALARALPERAPVAVRWEWQLDDPFEAVERA